MISEYLTKLGLEYPDVAERYRDKIRLINNVDPFTISKEDLDYSLDQFPAVSATDVIAYLVFSHSFYTQAQMKVHKSLDAHKYFEAGLVQILGITLMNEYRVVLGKVKHSQKMNLPPVQTWVICEAMGCVVSAHCTCMAGASEVCSHVGAVLYALEHFEKQKHTVSCTDQLAKWNAPLQRATPMLSLKEMLADKAKPGSAFPDVPTLSGDNLVRFLSEIQDDGGSCAVMATLEPFASQIAAERAKKNVPSPFEHLFKQENLLLNRAELINIGAKINIHLDAEQCANIFENTRKQRLTDAWYLHRKGRITASQLRKVLHTKLDNPSRTIVKEVCNVVKLNDASIKARSKPLRYGIENEKNALKAYIEKTSEKHQNFAFVESGLIIDPDFPEFGASPDGLCKCTCCGSGCVEVKCPYIFRDCTLQEYLNNKESCLESVGAQLKLKRDHNHYYQVQLQIKLSRRQYCDFVVWSPSEYFCERIYLDEPLWQESYPIAKTFHSEVIMPQLLGNYFTRTYSGEEIWCICKKSDNEEEPMLMCGNTTCKVKWYHLSCVELISVPTYAWRCDSCK